MAPQVFRLPTCRQRLAPLPTPIPRLWFNSFRGKLLTTSPAQTRPRGTQSPAQSRLPWCTSKPCLTTYRRRARSRRQAPKRRRTGQEAVDLGRQCLMAGGQSGRPGLERQSAPSLGRLLHRLQRRPGASAQGDPTHSDVAALPPPPLHGMALRAEEAPTQGAPRLGGVRPADQDLDAYRCVSARPPKPPNPFVNWL